MNPISAGLFMAERAPSIDGLGSSPKGQGSNENTRNDDTGGGSPTGSESDFAMVFRATKDARSADAFVNGDAFDSSDDTSGTSNAADGPNAVSDVDPSGDAPGDTGPDTESETGPETGQDKGPETPETKTPTDRDPPVAPRPDDDLPTGDAPGRDVPDGDLPVGDPPIGDPPNRDLPTGDLSDGDLPDGVLQDGVLQDGDIPDGDVPDRDLTGSTLVSDLPANDQLRRGPNVPLQQTGLGGDQPPLPGRLNWPDPSRILGGTTMPSDHPATFAPNDDASDGRRPDLAMALSKGIGDVSSDKTVLPPRLNSGVATHTLSGLATTGPTPSINTLATDTGVGQEAHGRNMSSFNALSDVLSPAENKRLSPAPNSRQSGQGLAATGPQVAPKIAQARTLFGTHFGAMAGSEVIAIQDAGPRVASGINASQDTGAVPPRPQVPHPTVESAPHTRAANHAVNHTVNHAASVVPHSASVRPNSVSASPRADGAANGVTPTKVLQDMPRVAPTQSPEMPPVGSAIRTARGVDSLSITAPNNDRNTALDGRGPRDAARPTTLPPVPPAPPVVAQGRAQIQPHTLEGDGEPWQSAQSARGNRDLGFNATTPATDAASSPAEARTGNAPGPKSLSAGRPTAQEVGENRPLDRAQMRGVQSTQVAPGASLENSTGPSSGQSSGLETAAGRGEAGQPWQQMSLSQSRSRGETPLSTKPIAKTPNRALPQTLPRAATRTAPRPQGAGTNPVAAPASGPVTGDAQAAFSELGDDTPYGRGLESTQTPASPLSQLSDAATQQSRQPAHAETARSVAQQLSAVTLRAGNDRIDVALFPEELGQVRLSISGQEGQILVTISAERADTSELIRRHLDLLAREFGAAGYADVAFAFDDGSQREASEHPRNSDDPPDTPRDNSAEPDKESTDAPLPPGPTPKSKSMDMRV